MVVQLFLSGFRFRMPWSLSFSRCAKLICSGINIVTYYAPTLFQSSLGKSQHESLLLGALLQVWYIAASFVTWFTIDRVGRRKLFISQALGMCLVLVAEAICVAINNTPAAIAAVVFVFAFEACFTWGACLSNTFILVFLFLFLFFSRFSLSLFLFLAIRALR